MKNGIDIYSNGPYCCSVCVPKGMKRKQIEKEVNLLNPTGLDHGWHISKNKTFSAGKPNPCVCDRDPSRKHYLLNC